MDRRYKAGKGQKAMMETQITITIKQDGEIKAEMNTGTGETEQQAAGARLTEQEAEKFAIVSDLANVCEYLTDSEVIKMRLIVDKEQSRKEREENGG